MVALDLSFPVGAGLKRQSGFLLSFHSSIRASPSLPYVPSTVGESVATRSSAPLPQGRLPRYHKVVCPATARSSAPLPQGRLPRYHKVVCPATTRSSAPLPQGCLPRYHKVVCPATARSSAPLPQGRLPRYYMGARGYRAIARCRRRCRRYHKVIYSATAWGSEATQPSLGAGGGAGAGGHKVVCPATARSSALLPHGGQRLHSHR
jgi:hypothetical protein